MSRLLSARGLGLTALALLAVGAMVALGLWQLGVYDDHQDADAKARLERAPVPLADVLGPDDALTSDDVGRPVVVSGRFDDTGQFFVEGFAGVGDGYAVVTPLVTADGSAILVVRGAADSTTPPSSPAGDVEVTGVLEPTDSGAAPLDDGRVTDGISVAAVVSTVDHDLYAGYVIATGSNPPDELQAVSPPPADASRWAGIRNLLYAFQWWLFAAFAVFMWWRILNEQSDSGPDEEAAPG